MITLPPVDPSSWEESPYPCACGSLFLGNPESIVLVCFGCGQRSSETAELSKLPWMEDDDSVD